MEKISFRERVYQLCSQVPRGMVTTYKEIALALGIQSSQAVGQALRCNPYSPFVPCHRVIRSDGGIGGFKGQRDGHDIQEKIALLNNEGITVKDGIIDLQQFGFRWSDEKYK